MIFNAMSKLFFPSDAGKGKTHPLMVSFLQLVKKSLAEFAARMPRRNFDCFSGDMRGGKTPSGERDARPSRRPSGPKPARSARVFLQNPRFQTEAGILIYTGWLVDLSTTSCAPPSTMETLLTSVSLAFSCSSGIVSAPQLLMVLRTLESVSWTLSLRGPA